MNLFVYESLERDRRVCVPWLKVWALSIASLLPAALSAASPGIEIRDAWVRATVPGQQVAGAYLQIQSPRNARIVAVKTPVAASAEIHSMSTEGGVMKMRKLDGLALPAGQGVELKPGGNHIMLLDIKRQLKPGERVPIELIVEEDGKKKSVKVEAEVREVR